ncbi:hypothetical protein [Nocardia sp. NPDC047654]
MDIQRASTPDEADRFAFDAGRTVIEQAKGMLNRILAGRPPQPYR